MGNDVNVLQRTKNAWGNLSRAQQIVLSVLAGICVVTVGLMLVISSLESRLAEQVAARQVAEEALVAGLRRSVEEGSRSEQLMVRLNKDREDTLKERNEWLEREQQLKEETGAALLQAEVGFNFMGKLTNPMDAVRLMVMVRTSLKQLGFSEQGTSLRSYQSVLDHMGQQMGLNAFVSQSALIAAKDLFFGNDALLMQALWGNPLVRPVLMIIAQENKGMLAMFAKYPELLTVAISGKDFDWDDVRDGLQDRDDKKLLALLRIDATKVTDLEIDNVRTVLAFLYRRTLDSSPAAVDSFRKIVAEIVGELFPTKKVAVTPTVPQATVTGAGAAVPAPVELTPPAVTPASVPPAPSVVSCDEDVMSTGDACVTKMK